MTIGLTLGDPAGIGPEVIQAALDSGKVPPVNYLLLGETRGHKPGRPTPRSAESAWASLEAAVALWREGQLDAIVTGPVCKETLHQVGFTFPGQTEFLAARCGVPEAQVVMMMTDPKLTVALVSTHCSLRQAVRQLTAKKLAHVIRLTSAHLQRLGKKQPRLAVAGLNPHAGENGLFGNEEQKIIRPVIAQLQAEGLEVSGAHSPDTVFYRATQCEFDAVICAYHDQGLIPFKLLAFTTGVNATLGLPLIRTSPDHGTAFDLAGKNQADPRSMIAAIRLAYRLAKSNTSDQLTLPQCAQPKG
jgi:4-phospho-D-threonate 3-dehydrogenase / 4-phospho-D-erythronate 3-dehydrogenase